MKRLVEAHFSLALLAFCLVGLVLPGLEELPTSLVVVCLGCVIFLACFKLRLAELQAASWPHFALFYGLRFLLLPAALFYLMQQLLPAYAVAALLLSLAPPATSSPAFAGLFGGNVALAFALTVVGNVLSMGQLPLVLGLLASSSVQLDLGAMLVTLSLCIALPVALFAALRGRPGLNSWALRNSSFVSILLIGMTFTVAVAKRRALILAAPTKLLLPLLVSSGVFAVFYVFGWLVLRRRSRSDRISFGLASGANNISLAVSLALLYFPPEVALFLLAAELPWVLALAPFRYFLRRAEVA